MRPSAPGRARDPHWYRDAVIYQLHVKSFFDANDDGIGDFAGLMRKLDYIAELGVDTLWLLPFYPSPRRDDGYDISDYRGVHPDYGTLADVRRFLREAHRRGLNVITELVINHTSDQHPWFQRARRAPPGSRERDFYVWSDSDDRYAGTRIIFCDTETSNWTWDEVAGAYYWHRFYSHQPDLNFDNPSVLREVIAAMRFWLDLGVDGLRLDAVPYLVEREGTNNENLPETHVILKKIRAELDRAYPGRMLLAEANQWPEDVKEYFGDGDECHMAFHFPLMPRMYMAIAMEDRFPITDILRQTPEIPEGAQWAIFLRNHDELTLEMVTDRERDYLWATYAADRRARLNLGIRRRLAPLLERDRRRIELMKALLFSMPGTPVIYYGDEIGMGDNIYLGDRDGVRTPMQWSPDRNGGFSRADPARLVLPPIQDPLYGYQAVNVEAQERDPHSLLNWTRRILAVRARTRAFGRGTLRLLYPENRKVLAYLREEGPDTILCVYNLSRIAQAVELDLSAFAGRVPVEMLGGSTFPPIGRLSYLLTLPPYGFFWFLLAEEAALPPWRVPVPEPLPELRTIVVPRGATELLNPAVRRELEREILLPWLGLRRWIARFGEAPSSARIVAHTTLPHTDGYVALAEIEATVRGNTSRWFLPVAVVGEETTNPLPAQLALSRLRQAHRVGWLTDAYASDAFGPAVLQALAEGAVLPMGEGEIRFLPGPAALPQLPRGESAIRRHDAEAEEPAFILADTVLLRLIRRLRAGTHPVVEMTRHLTRLGFPAAPALLGEVVRADRSGEQATVLIAQSYVRSQGDGAGWTRDWLARALDELAADAVADEDPFAGYRPIAQAIGRRLGELHVLLAAPCDDPAFAPSRADAALAAAWAERTRDRLKAALARAAAIAAPDPVPPAAALRTTAARVRRRLPGLAKKGIGSVATRVHGAFRLGNVLIAQGDIVMVGFARDEERPAERTSPLADLASMLASIDLAAATVLSDGTGAGRGQERRATFIEQWRRDTAAAVRDAWCAVVADRLAGVAAAIPSLLDLFALDAAAETVLREGTAAAVAAFAATLERLGA